MEEIKGEIKDNQVVNVRKPVRVRRGSGHEGCVLVEVGPGRVGREAVVEGKNQKRKKES
jgi:hypothetical protein